MSSSRIVSVSWGGGGGSLWGLGSPPSLLDAPHGSPTLLQSTKDCAENHLRHPAPGVLWDFHSNLPPNSQPALVLPDALGHIREESATVTSRSPPKLTVSNQLGSQVAHFGSVAKYVPTNLGYWGVYAEWKKRGRETGGSRTSGPSWST